EVADLPTALPTKKAEAVLYRRILDRIRTPGLAAIARAALVLRRLTTDMIGAVLDGPVSLEGRDPAAIYEDLRREMALVDGDSALRLRPDVRAAVLSLLEQDEPALVSTIDQRAAAYYEALKSDSAVDAAELVYHRLRLDDVAAARAAWREGCEVYL